MSGEAAVWEQHGYQCGEAAVSAQPASMSSAAELLIGKSHEWRSCSSSKHIHMHGGVFVQANTYTCMEELLFKQTHTHAWRSFCSSKHIHMHGGAFVQANTYTCMEELLFKQTHTHAWRSLCSRMPCTVESEARE
jgi:hypothetical protein